MLDRETLQKYFSKCRTALSNTHTECYKKVPLLLLQHEPINATSSHFSKTKTSDKSKAK